MKREPDTDRDVDQVPNPVSPAHHAFPRPFSIALRGKSPAQSNGGPVSRAEEIDDEEEEEDDKTEYGDADAAALSKGSYLNHSHETEIKS